MKIWFFILCIIYFLATFVIPSFIVWRRTGHSPIVLSGGKSVYDFTGNIFKISSGLIFLNIILFCFFEPAYQLLSPINYLINDSIIVIGFGIIIFSLILVVIAQYQMSNSWRIGIDTKNKTD